MPTESSAGPDGDVPFDRSGVITPRESPSPPLHAEPSDLWPDEPRPFEPTGPRPVDLFDDLRSRVSPAHAAGVVGAVLVALVAGWWLLRPQPVPPEQTLPLARPAPATTEPAPTTAPDVAVHVTGRVAAPGVYRLGSDSLVQDALVAAGGPAPEADLQRLNLAATVLDGMQIWVPGKDESPPDLVGPTGPVGPAGGNDGEPGTEVSGPVDLNSASATELEELPGVGPVTSAAIIAHRDENGPFRSVDALLDVNGIGPAKLEAVRDLVTI